MDLRNKNSNNDDEACNVTPITTPRRPVENLNEMFVGKRRNRSGRRKQVGLKAFYGRNSSGSRSRSGVRETEQLPSERINAKSRDFNYDVRSNEGLSAVSNSRSMKNIPQMSKKNISLAGCSNLSDLKKKQQIVRTKARSPHRTMLDEGVSMGKQYFQADEIHMSGSQNHFENDSAQRHPWQKRSVFNDNRNDSAQRVNLVLRDSRVTPRKISNVNNSVAISNGNHSAVNSFINDSSQQRKKHEEIVAESFRKINQSISSKGNNYYSDQMIRNPFVEASKKNSVRSNNDSNLDNVYKERATLQVQNKQQVRLSEQPVDPVSMSIGQIHDANLESIQKTKVKAITVPDTPIDELFQPYEQAEEKPQDSAISNSQSLLDRRTITVEEVKAFDQGRISDDFGFAPVDYQQHYRSHAANEANQSIRSNGQDGGHMIGRDTFGDHNYSKKRSNEDDEVSETPSILLAKIDAELQSVQTGTVSQTTSNIEVQRRLLKAEAEIQKLQKQNEQLAQEMQKTNLSKNSSHQLNSQQQIPQQSLNQDKEEESPIVNGNFGDNIVLVGKDGSVFNRALAPDHEGVYLDNPSLESLVKEFDAEQNDAQLNEIISFNQGENNKNAKRNAGVSHSRLGKQEQIVQSTVESPDKVEEEQMPEGLDDQYIFHLNELIKMLRTPPFHQDNMKMRKKLAQHGLDLSSNEAYIMKMKSFLSCHENYLKARKRMQEQNANADLSNIQPMISTHNVIDFYVDMKQKFSEQASRLRNLYNSGAVNIKSDLDSYYGGINYSRHGMSLNNSNKSIYGQCLRVAPDTIEMQIKFLITLLSSIEEKMNAERRTPQQSLQSNVIKSSEQDLRKIRTPTDNGSLGSGLRVGQWANSVASPALRQRPDNRLSQPMNYLPGNQVKLATDERADSIAYGSTAARYHPTPRIEDRQETMFEQLARVPLYQHIRDIFQFGSPYTEVGSVAGGYQPQMMSQPTLSNQAQLAPWHSQASQQSQATSGKLFDVTIGPHSNLSKPGIERATDDDVPEIDDVISEEEREIASKEAKKNLLQPTGTQSIEITSMSRPPLGATVGSRHSLDKSDAESKRPIIMTSAHGTGQLHGSEFQKIGSSTSQNAHPRIGNIFKDTRSREVKRRSPNNSTVRSSIGSQMKSSGALRKIQVQDTAQPKATVMTEQKSLQMRRKQVPALQDYLQATDEFRLSRGTGTTGEAIQNQKVRHFEPQKDMGDSWTSAHDSNYIGAGLAPSTIKKNMPANRLAPTSFNQRSRCKDDKLIVVNNSMSWCSQNDKDEQKANPATEEEKEMQQQQLTPPVSARNRLQPLRSDSASFRSNLSNRSRDRLQKKHEQFREKLDQERASIIRASAVKTPAFDINGGQVSSISRSQSPNRQAQRPNIFKSANKNQMTTNQINASPVRSDNMDNISQIEASFISIKQFQQMCRHVQREYYKGNKFAEQVTMQDLMPMYRKASKIVSPPSSCQSDQVFFNTLRNFILKEYKQRLPNYEPKTTSITNKQQASSDYNKDLEVVRDFQPLGANAILTLGKVPEHVDELHVYGQPENDDAMTGKDSHGSKETRKFESSQGLKRWGKQLDQLDVQTEKKPITHSKVEPRQSDQHAGNVVHRRSSRSIKHDNCVHSSNQPKRSRKLEKSPALSKYITDSRARLERLSNQHIDNNWQSSQSAQKVYRRLADDLRDSHASNQYDSRLDDSWSKNPSPKKEGKGDTPKFQRRNLFNDAHHSSKQK